MVFFKKKGAPAEDLISENTNTKDVEGGAEKVVTNPDEGPDQEYPSHKKLWVIMPPMYLVMFVASLDRSILSPAIPKITDDFHSLKDIGWYAGAYMICNCATQLLYGRFYTFYSSKVVYLSAITIFELGSLVCALAPNSIAFIIGRGIAGCGTSGIMAGNIVLITQVLPLYKRPKFMGIFGAVMGISAVAGPLIGGALTDKASWRWCFWINIPCGVVAGIIYFFFVSLAPVKPVSIREQIDRLDPLGTLCFLPSIICLLLALQWGGTTYAWKSWRVILLFIIFGLLFASFICIQIWKGENATIAPRLAKQRTVLSSAIYSFGVGGSMVTIVGFLPVWFQAIKGTTATQSGINTLPIIIGMVIFAFLSAGVISKTGWYNPWMILGPILLTIGSGLLTTLNVDSTTSQWIGFEALVGFGLGAGMQQSNMAIQAVLRKVDVPMGVSLVFLCQGLGGSIFICAAQSIFSSTLVANLSGIAGLDPQLILATGATDLRNIVSPEMLPMLLIGYNVALVSTFKIGIACASLAFAASWGVEWICIKGMKQGGAIVKPGEGEGGEKKTEEIEKTKEKEKSEMPEEPRVTELTISEGKAES